MKKAPLPGLVVAFPSRRRSLPSVASGLKSASCFHSVGGLTRSGCSSLLAQQHMRLLLTTGSEVASRFLQQGIYVSHPLPAATTLLDN
ncbi:hypothetical protein AVEN_257814-1 [Araneus ventricosus]|uniref:Uncharacterized protein n=1 Tax=Araneus ventricosus TaxID=182803 RepID=A0A4Y2UHX3_ARAVE|nr:hypothetical protein AVEN_257814-1 [Araneus ventricosus]